MYTYNKKRFAGLVVFINYVNLYLSTLLDQVAIYVGFYPHV